MITHIGQRVVLAVAVATAAATAGAAAGPRAVTWEDLMRFRSIEDPVIAADGSAVAFAATPDRGDGEGIVRRLADGTALRVPRGTAPVISADGRWVAFSVAPPLEAREKSGKHKPKPGLALVDVSSGAVVEAERVDRFELSDDSRWIAWLHAPADADDTEKVESAREPAAGERPETAKASGDDDDRGGVLVLRALAGGARAEIADVTAFAFDPAGAYLACVLRRADGSGSGVVALDLHAAEPTEIEVKTEDRLVAKTLAWSEKGSLLAFAAGVAAEKAGGADPRATVWVWDGSSRALTAVPAPPSAPAGWSVPVKTELSWSRDGARLYFGWRPAEDGGGDTEGEDGAPFDPYDLASIRARAGVDVWHWKDPRIVTQQKEAWKQEQERVYRAAFHRGDGTVAVLGDPTVPEVEVPEGGAFALGWSAEPYAREMTWDGRYRDLYAIRIADGSRTRIATRIRGRASLSPGGRFVAYFADGRWILVDAATGAQRDLTGGLDVGFADEENDEPQPASPYGLAGWLENDAALLLYDRYDVWQVPADGGAAMTVTAGEGRKRGIRFRVEDPDPDEEAFAAGEPLLLTAFHEHDKSFGFYRAVPGHAGVTRLLDEKKRFTFVARAEDAPLLLYTRQSFEEFPDLWVADPGFRTPRKVTDVNPQMAELAWGSAELVEWRSLGGVPLQGVLIKPAGYREGTSYPLLVYFYERMSDRLYSFNQPVVNHRPSFPLYASDGYAIFLPDVVYEVGRPGLSATRCVVPGVLELVRRGIADPDRLGLHGHSWGGYETGFVITQTDIFDAAIAGAPVSNMTSAYGGIRWESGLARQFQYERTQSRLGASLWADPVAYLENSPLFFANRITTPLLIEFGDADGAVPWTQGIEFYLAMRRLGKDCVMLTYRGEPHHVKKYPNKLDYAMKMKEYLDHYLKGAPAPAWLAEGVPYSGT